MDAYAQQEYISSLRVFATYFNNPLILPGSDMEKSLESSRD
jgi:hypothetical protein